MGRVWERQLRGRRDTVRNTREHPRIRRGRTSNNRRQVRSPENDVPGEQARRLGTKSAEGGLSGPKANSSDVHRQLTQATSVHGHVGLASGEAKRT